MVVREEACGCRDEYHCQRDADGSFMAFNLADDVLDACVRSAYKTRGLRSNIKRCLSSRLSCGDLLQHTPQVRPKVVNLLVTIAGIFCKGPIQNRLQLSRQSSAHFREWLGGIVKYRVSHIDTCLSTKRPGARQHFVE